MSNSSQEAASGAPTLLAREAYEATLEELESLSEDRIVPVNISVPNAISTALGCINKVQPFRERIARLPGLKLQSVDSLERYALTLAHAQIRLNFHDPLAGAQLTRQEAIAKARAVRQRLRADLRALVNRKLVNSSALSSNSKARGFRALALDLLAFCALFRAEWPRLERRCGVTLAELKEAEQLAERVLGAVAEHKYAPETSARELRNRAFTLLVGSYQETRDALRFLLRGTAELDDVIPSLYAGRRRPRRR